MYRQLIVLAVAEEVEAGSHLVANRQVSGVLSDAELRPVVFSRRDVSHSCLAPIYDIALTIEPVAYAFLVLVGEGNVISAGPELDFALLASQGGYDVIDANGEVLRAVVTIGLCLHLHFNGLLARLLIVFQRS